MPSSRGNTSSNPTCQFCGETDVNLLVPGENDKHYCRTCIANPDNNIFLCQSPNCNKHLSLLDNELYMTGQGIMCKEHFTENYFTCKCCGEPLQRKSHGRVLASGEYVCNTCFERDYFTCPDCGNVHKNEENNYKEVIDRNGNKRKICMGCFNKNYITCSECGEYIQKNTMITFDIRNPETNKVEHVKGCKACIQKKYEKCSCCNTWYIKGQMELFTEVDVNDNKWTYCKFCYATQRVIHDYSFKPKPTFYVKQDLNKFEGLFFGVENEIECPSDNGKKYKIEGFENRDSEVDIRRHIAIEVEKRFPSFFYQKRDGSLSYGIEIVSHPASIEFWHDQEENLNKLFEFLNGIKCRGDTASTAGMHIHVSRKNITREHKHNISAFIYCNRDNVQKIAGRSGSSYAQFKSVNTTDKNEERIISSLTEREERYDAINWKNKGTMELRMFQSTLMTKRFLSNIEFAFASYVFSQQGTLIDMVDESCWGKFCEFTKKMNLNFLRGIMEEKRVLTV